METLKKSRWFWCLGVFCVLVLLDNVVFAFSFGCEEPKIIEQKPLNDCYYKFIIDDNNTPSDHEDDKFLVYKAKCQDIKQVAIIDRLNVVRLDPDMDEESFTKFKNEDLKQDYLKREFDDLNIIKWKTGM